MRRRRVTGQQGTGGTESPYIAHTRQVYSLFSVFPTTRTTAPSRVLHTAHQILRAATVQEEQIAHGLSDFGRTVMTGILSRASFARNLDSTVSTIRNLRPPLARSMQ
jgi:hypothetical protein